MRHFTDLYLALDDTTRTSEKTAALARYFNDAPPADAAWATALLMGERPKGSASSAVLKNLALEAAQVPNWLFRECRAAVGDLSETIALILPDNDALSDAEPEQHNESLAETIERRVVPLAGAKEDERATIIKQAWADFDRDQRFVYHKLVRGGFRVGVAKGVLARALAEVAGVETAEMQHRLAGTFEPTPQAFEALLDPNADAGPKPFPFYLAKQLETDPEDLGDINEWIAEWKYDGIRAQLINRNNQIHLWSRGQELITHQFPEITAAANQLPAGTTLDGEILMWKGDKPAAFAELQKRLNRKTAPSPQLGLFETTRAVFMAFDQLERTGDDIRDLDTEVRIAALAQTLEAIEAQQTIRISVPHTDLSPPARAPAERHTWQSLAAVRTTARDQGVEGLMLKHKASPYMAGRIAPTRGGGWLKWKLDPLTADAVMVYAYPGSGRRATLYTDYAFAVWSQTTESNGVTTRSLVPFTRAYSGLDQSEIEELDRWIRQNTTRRMGPAREVKPLRVFEIGFEGIARSDRHKAGIAVRFPRILRERTDKPPEEADTVESLEALLPEQ